MQAFNRARDVVLALVMLTPVISVAGDFDADLIIACSKQSDDALRLACYDAAVSSVGTPNRSRSSDVAQSTSRPAPTPPAIDEDEFGLEGSEAAKQRRAQRAESGEVQEIRSLTAVVSEVAFEAHGQLVITLDNEQVWKQKTRESYFPVKVGDRITINAGLLGSYRMVNGKRSTQVTRVK